MAMLLRDYGSMIIHSICDSPNFLTAHFKREIKKLSDMGYEADEIKYDFFQVIKLIKNQTETIYEQKLKTYHNWEKEDKVLPKEKKYNYPKPIIDEIPILKIKYNSDFIHDLSGLTKRIYLKDIAKVENVLNQLLGKEIEEEGLNKEGLVISQIKNNFDFVDINEVYQHFKAGLVDKKYLSEEELLKYLKAAFDKKTPRKKLFILADVNSKQKIKKIFNQYYKTIAGKPHGKQKEYAALLGNYFRGYTTENVSTNFSK